MSADMMRFCLSVALVCKALFTLYRSYCFVVLLFTALALSIACASLSALIQLYTFCEVRLLGTRSLVFPS